MNVKKELALGRKGGEDYSGQCKQLSAVQGHNWYVGGTKKSDWSVMSKREREEGGWRERERYSFRGIR